mmetsp:Transcript_5251/g.10487  ORF Transcript_5251/g.10487 Transcript_5251/m.10487 type:complete len:214 (-) Transcript_5251:418-1059(-)
MQSPKALSSIHLLSISSVLSSTTLTPSFSISRLVYPPTSLCVRLKPLAPPVRYAVRALFIPSLPSHAVFWSPTQNIPPLLAIPGLFKPPLLLKKSSSPPISPTTSEFIPAHVGGKKPCISSPVVPSLMTVSKGKYSPKSAIHPPCPTFALPPLPHCLSFVALLSSRLGQCSSASLQSHIKLHLITTSPYHFLASSLVRSTVPNWNSSLALLCT